MGYCGSGVSLSSYFGTRLGQRIAGLPEGETPLTFGPVPDKTLLFRESLVSGSFDPVLPDERPLFQLTVDFLMPDKPVTAIDGTGPNPDCQQGFFSG